MIGSPMLMTTIFNSKLRGIQRIPDQTIPVVAEDKPLLEQKSKGTYIDLTTDEKILAEEQKVIFNGLIEIGIIEEPKGELTITDISNEPIEEIEVEVEEEEQTEEDALIAPYGYTKSGKIRTKPLKSQLIVNGLE